MLNIRFKPETERRLREVAAQRGCDVNAYVEELVERTLKSEAPPQGESVREWLERIAGTGTPGVTTDELMRMTRGDA